MKLRYLAFILLTLTACTTPPTAPPTTTDWDHRQQQLARIAHWSLTGRVAINNGVESWHLNVSWQQRDDEYEIMLHGPFGTGKVRLQGNQEGVVLQKASNETYYANNAQQLLYEQTGVTMPVAGLRYWIVGLPEPDVEQQQSLDSHGRLSSLDYAAWSVNFRRYTSVNGLELPNKIFIEKPGRQLDVRLVIDKWQLGAI